jgi:hypothetical protein
LFDGVGHSLDFIAGVATDEQLDLLNHKVEQLTSTDQKVTHMLQDKLTYFRNTQSREIEQRDAINQLGSGLSAISERVNRFINSSSLQVKTFNQQVRVLATINSVTSQSRQNLYLISSEITRIDICEEAAMQGRLSPQLLDSSKFLDTLQQIQSHLTEHLALLDPPSSVTLPNY